MAAVYVGSTQNKLRSSFGVYGYAFDRTVNGLLVMSPSSERVSGFNPRQREDLCVEFS